MKTLQIQLGANARRGVTLVELMLALALFGLIMSLGITITDSARGAYLQTSKSSLTESDAKVTLDRIAAEFEMAAMGSMNPSLEGPLITSSSSMSLMQVIDIVGGAAVLGNLITIGFVQDPNDAADGVDNDGDGLVDEGHLVMVRGAAGPNPQAVTLCRNVRQFLEGEEAGVGDENGNGLTNEAGFLIRRDGDLLTLQLTVERVLANGNTNIRTNTTSVRLRN